MKDRLIHLPANIYQHFDVNLTLDVPAEGMGGWQSLMVDLPLEHTALVSMHAWQFESEEVYPGLYRTVEYIGRANEIMRTTYAPILEAARDACMPVLHVVGGGDYFKAYPGYAKTLALAGDEPIPAPGAPEDPSIEKLNSLREAYGFPGSHNQAETEEGHIVTFPGEAEPVGAEPIAQTAHQLNAICRHLNVSHLIYIGFAINWCLLFSPAGMIDMSRHGYLCSTVRQATTAVENKQTARQQLAKELALWRVSLAFGFVFDSDPLIAVLKTAAQ